MAAKGPSATERQFIDKTYISDLRTVERRDGAVEPQIIEILVPAGCILGSRRIVDGFGERIGKQRAQAPATFFFAPSVAAHCNWT